MYVPIAEAKNRLAELIRAVEAGQQVVITRDGEPFAFLGRAPLTRRKVRLGEMKNRIKFLPGWDDPFDLGL